MSKTSASVLDAFLSRLQSVDATRRKIENLHSLQNVSRRQTELMYEALFLRAFTELESLIESLFLGLLTGRIDPANSRIVPRVTFSSQVVARDVVYSGRNYVDWMPYERTTRLASAFFRGTRPFSYITGPDVQELNKLIRVRNVLAHKSVHARRLFLEEVIGNTPLLPRERTSAGYLRSPVLGTAPRQTRFEYHLSVMAAMARKLCS